MKDFENKRIVVTGGAGFIGSHLVRKLKSLGAFVSVIDDFTNSSRNRVGPEDRLIPAAIDSCGQEELDSALAGADYLFHLAAVKHKRTEQGGGSGFLRNVIGAYRLFTAAVENGVEKIVYTSSLYVYGRSSPSAFFESGQVNPTTLYGISKLDGELVLAALCRDKPTAFSVLRLFFVYGPYQHIAGAYPTVITKNLTRLLTGLPPVVNGDGSQVLDYVYVEDVVEALVKSALAGEKALTLNVGSGTGISVLNLVGKLLAAAGGNGTGNIEYRPRDETHGTSRVADTERISRVLGWRPGTSLEDGINQTLNWLKSEMGRPEGWDIKL